MNKKRIIVNGIFSAMVLLLLVWKGVFAISDGRLYIISMIIFAYISYSEAIDQRRRILDWENIHHIGKTRFILLEYVIYRGGTISVLIILLLSLKIQMTVLLLCSVLPLLGVSAIAGNEVWKQCEEGHSAMILKSAAEKMKISQN